MKGRGCLITGATSGIGAATARALADRGADLILLCRNRAKGERLAARMGAGSVHLIECDLARLDQVRAAAQVFLDLDRPLHVLVNNAAVFNIKRRVTGDGFEEMFAVNHLAHFLLTQLLLPRLRESAAARIVTMGSGAHKLVREMNFADLQFRQGFRPLRVYSHSKLANMLFSHELARRLDGSGVTANLVDPGEVATGLGRQNGGVTKLLLPLLHPFLRPPDKGAETPLHACCAESLQGVSGVYLRDCRIHTPRPWAADGEAARKLWWLSAEMVSP